MRTPGTLHRERARAAPAGLHSCSSRRLTVGPLGSAQMRRCTSAFQLCRFSCAQCAARASISFSRHSPAPSRERAKPPPGRVSAESVQARSGRGMGEHFGFRHRPAPSRELAKPPPCRASAESVQVRSKRGTGHFGFRHSPAPSCERAKPHPAKLLLNRLRWHPDAAWVGHFGFPLSFPCHLPEAPNTPSIYPAARPIAVCEKRPGDPVTWAQRLPAVSRAFRYSRP